MQSSGIMYPMEKGCNKDRHKAKHLIVEDFDNIAAEVEAKLQDRLLFL